jgi:quercetin dioxygenase-like cupin family protein
MGPGLVRSVSVADKRRFSSRRALLELLYGSRRVRAFLLCLEPGQGLPARPDSEEMVCYLIEGRATVTVGDQSLALSAGDFAAAGAGEVRGIEAQERTTALWVHISAANGGPQA